MIDKKVNIGTLLNDRNMLRREIHGLRIAISSTEADQHNLLQSLQLKVRQLASVTADLRYFRNLRNPNAPTQKQKVESDKKFNDWLMQSASPDNPGLSASKTSKKDNQMKNKLTDSIMEQAQVFASTWSLVGGMFDDGNCLEDAEAAKVELRGMVEQALDTAANEVIRLQANEHSLRDEIAALRQIISDTVAAIGSGAGVGVECSLGFLQQIPEEVCETTKALRKGAERLSWIHASLTGTSIRGTIVNVLADHHSLDSFLSAIDAAMPQAVQS